MKKTKKKNIFWRTGGEYGSLSDTKKTQLYIYTCWHSLGASGNDHHTVHACMLYGKRPFVCLYTHPSPTEIGTMVTHTHTLAVSGEQLFVRTRDDACVCVCLSLILNGGAFVPPLAWDYMKGRLFDTCWLPSDSSMKVCCCCCAHACHHRMETSNVSCGLHGPDPLIGGCQSEWDDDFTPSTCGPHTGARHARTYLPHPPAAPPHALRIREHCIDVDLHARSIADPRARARRALKSGLEGTWGSPESHTGQMPRVVDIGVPLAHTRPHSVYLSSLAVYSHIHYTLEPSHAFHTAGPYPRTRRAVAAPCPWPAWHTLAHCTCASTSSAPAAPRSPGPCGPCARTWSCA